MTLFNWNEFDIGSEDDFEYEPGPRGAVTDPQYLANVIQRDIIFNGVPYSFEQLAHKANANL